MVSALLDEKVASSTLPSWVVITLAETGFIIAEDTDAMEAAVDAAMEEAAVDAEMEEAAVREQEVLYTQYIIYTSVTAFIQYQQLT